MPMPMFARAVDGEHPAVAGHQFLAEIELQRIELRPVFGVDPDGGSGMTIRVEADAKRAAHARALGVGINSDSHTGTAVRIYAKVGPEFDAPRATAALVR